MQLPTISVPPALTVKEGSKLAIPVRKTGSGPCSIQLKTAGSTAQTKKDYIGYEPAWLIRFAPEESVRYAYLHTIADIIQEPPEKLTIHVTNPIGCTVIQDTCEITIDDLPRISIPEHLSVREGETLAIPITKEGTGECTFKLRTSGDTARTLLDYVGYDPLPQFTLKRNQTTAIAYLRTVADADLEPPETLTVSIVENRDCKIRQSKCTVRVENVAPPTPEPNPDPIEPDPEPDPGPDPDPEPDVVMPEPLPNAYRPAVGFATGMNAGEGKPIYRVTSLNDGGPGSLREGIKGGNKLVTFETSGCIRLKSDLVIDAGNLTIAGQTSPGAGITIQGKELQVKASNVRIEHITVERGHDRANTGNADVVKVSPGSSTSTFKRSNIHFNHCAFLWGMDETVEIWPSGGNLSSISFTNCIFAEPLWRPQKLGFAAHDKVAKGVQSEHNYGVLIGYGTKKVDIQNCLFTDMYFRTPFIDHGTTSVMANNVLMNVRMGVCIHFNTTPPPREPCLVNAQGILCISGPQSNAHSGFRFHKYPPRWPAGSAVYVSKLAGWKGANATVTPGNTVTFAAGQPTQGPDNRPVLTDKPPIQPPGTTIRALDSEDLYKMILINCGPMPKAGKRNTAVSRIISNLKAKKSSWVDHESQVGGFSNYSSASRKLEAATMPDGTPIPVPDARNVASIRTWLAVHSSLISND